MALPSDHPFLLIVYDLALFFVFTHSATPSLAPTTPDSSLFCSPLYQGCPYPLLCMLFRYPRCQRSTHRNLYFASFDFDGRGLQLVKERRCHGPLRTSFEERWQIIPSRGCDYGSQTKTCKSKFTLSGREMGLAEDFMPQVGLGPAYAGIMGYFRARHTFRGSFVTGDDDANAHSRAS